MSRTLSILSISLAASLFAAVVNPRVAVAENGGSEAEEGARDGVDNGSEEGSDEESKNEGEASNGDATEGMSEEERAEWKKQTRRAEQIAIQHAAAPGGWLERSWTWDFNADLGYRVLGTPQGWTFRVRSGLTRIAEPNAFSLGVTGRVEPGGPPVAGLQLEMLSLHLGTFARLGAGLNFDGAAHWSAGVGWQIFGIEAGYRPAAPAGARWRGLALLRIPVSWIIRGVAPDSG